MLEKILLFLFPKTIHKMINTSIKEANIIHQYGSMENYYQAMNEYAEAIEADEYFESINNPSL
jgi:hypothetical protein